MSFVYQPITCSSEINYTFMSSMIRTLCPPDFVPDVVTSSRCKKVFGGKCCWTAYYRSMTFGNVKTKDSFKEAIKRIISNIPHGSKVVAYGRYGSPDFGIFVTYGNTHCICLLDFEEVKTPFPFLEQRINQSIILFVCESEIDIDNILGESDDDTETEANGWFEMTQLTMNCESYRSANLELADNFVIQPEVIIFRKETLDYVDLVATSKDVEMMVVSENGEFVIWCRPLKGNGMIKMFNIVGDKVYKITRKMDENDDLLFEDKIVVTENLDTHVQKLHSAINALVIYREEEHTRISRELSQLADVEVEFKFLWVSISNDESKDTPIITWMKHLHEGHVK